MSNAPDLFAQQSAMKSTGKDEGGEANTGLKIGGLKKGAHNLAKVTGLSQALGGVNVGAAFDHGGIQANLERGAVTDGTIPSLLTSGLAVSTGPFAAIAKFCSDLLKNGMKIDDLTGGIQAMQWVESPIASLGTFSPPAVGQSMDVGGLSV